MLVVNWFAVNNLLRLRVRYTVIKADFCRGEYPYWRFFFCQTLSFLVQSFVRTGIPVCEVTFREHQDDVINLLKKVQVSTRQLQHAACHSKVCCCNHLIANVFVGNWNKNCFKSLFEIVILAVILFIFIGIYHCICILWNSNNLKMAFNKLFGRILRHHNSSNFVLIKEK